jgi:hypothetical protein
VSLVLEALKKLDREKGREERGFVVMAATPWPTRAARRWPLWAALAVVVAAGTWGIVVRKAARPATADAPAPTATPAPAVAAPTASLALGPAVSVPVSVPPAAPAPALRRPAARTTAAAEPSPAAGTDPEAVPALPAASTPAASAPRAAAAAASPAPPALVLQAISQRDGKPIAIVNDHLVREGDEVDGIRVLAIRADEVDVEFQGRRTTLRF